MIEAIIFHPEVLTHLTEDDRARMLSFCSEKNLTVFIHSNFGGRDVEDLASEVRSHRLTVHEMDAKKLAGIYGKSTPTKKGSNLWIEYIDKLHGIRSHKIVYLAHKKFDWLSAINGGAFYLHADWAKARANYQPQVVQLRSVMGFEQFYSLLLEPDTLWTFRLDIEDPQVRFRSLINVNTRLSCDDSKTFNLKDVYTYDQDIKISEAPAEHILMLYSMVQLWKEGLLQPNSHIIAYPGHKEDSDSWHINRYIPVLKASFKSFSKTQILRWRTTVDKSLAKRDGKRHLIKFSEEFNSLRLNKIPPGPTVVIDDFNTSGLSLEAARNLLKQSGCSDITLCSIGKYGSRYNIHILDDGISIDPLLSSDKIDEYQHSTVEKTLTENMVSQQSIIDAFKSLSK